MKTFFKQKLFIGFIAVFLLFTLGFIIFERQRERQSKTEALTEKIKAYATMTDKALAQGCSPDSVLRLLPGNMRLSVINKNGELLYDSQIQNTDDTDNHAGRPEIIEAAEQGEGSSIRFSESREREYFYYAKRSSNGFVRVALPYDVQLRRLLEPDNFFLYLMLAFFGVILLLNHFAVNRFGKSITELKNFTDLVESGQWDGKTDSFPEDELGEIGKRIVQNYHCRMEHEKTIIREREKLLQHVHSSEEGLCFFSANRTVEFYNGLFIQYLNIIADEAGNSSNSLFSEKAFESVKLFLDSRRSEESYFETKIRKQGKIFAVHVVVFDDQSFEIIINNISEQEKTRQLKQEMTGNIAHELRTPITGIRGCLETVFEQQLSAEKERYFIRSAYEQVLKLSDLIQDMSLITKIEGAPQSFRVETVELTEMLENLKNDFSSTLQEKHIEMTWDVADVIIAGNRTLLYSIFRNLTDNAVRYAGENVQIIIKKYNEDNHFYYLSYADTGVGVPEEHLNRLFERFYRADEGRTRDAGGSGLGLSIVKNAVLFHKCNITAKNRVGGGIEFLFTLPKGQ